MERVWKTMVLAVLMALLAAACGGGESSEDDGATTTTSPTSTTTGDAPATTTTTTEDGDDPAPPAGDVNVATVSIDGTEYVFDVTPDAIYRCDPNFFGAFWAIGVSADGSGGSLELLLPPEGDENFDDPPAVKVTDDANDLEWRADPEFWATYDQLAGLPIGVDSWEVDGSSVTGTATFLESNAGYAFIGGTGEEPTPVPGTFSVTCADE